MVPLVPGPLAPCLEICRPTANTWAPAEQGWAVAWLGHLWVSSKPRSQRDLEDPCGWHVAMQERPHLFCAGVRHGDTPTSSLPWAEVPGWSAQSHSPEAWRWETLEGACSWPGTALS